jgi:hypothetical protein
VIVKASQEVNKEYSESSTTIANTGKSADIIPDSNQTPTATRNKQPTLPAGKSMCCHGVHSLSKRCLPSSSLKMDKSSEKIICEEKSNGPNRTATDDESDAAHKNKLDASRDKTDAPHFRKTTRRVKPHTSPKCQLPYKLPTDNSTHTNVQNVENILTHKRSFASDGRNSGPPHAGCIFPMPWMRRSSGTLRIVMLLGFGFVRLGLADETAANTSNNEAGDAVPCVDDPASLLASAGTSCAAVLPLGCEYDLHELNPAAPAGSLLKAFCPSSCDFCAAPRNITSNIRTCAVGYTACHACCDINWTCECDHICVGNGVLQGVREEHYDDALGCSYDNAWQYPVCVQYSTHGVFCPFATVGLQMSWAKPKWSCGATWGEVCDYTLGADPADDFTWRRARPSGPDIPPPQGFTRASTLAHLCPLHCAESVIVQAPCAEEAIDHQQQQRIASWKDLQTAVDAAPGEGAAATATPAIFQLQPGTYHAEQEIAIAGSCTNITVIGALAGGTVLVA